jgi:hypothetical protein
MIPFKIVWIKYTGMDGEGMAFKKSEGSDAISGYLSHYVREPVRLIHTLFGFIRIGCEKL